MNENRNREILLKHLILGFFSGLFISFLIFFILLLSKEEPFTFQTILRYHKDLPILFVIDLFPVYLAISAYFFGRIRIKEFTSSNARNEEELTKNKEVEKIIHNLTIGNLNTEIESDIIDQNLLDTLRSLQSKLRDNREKERLSRNEQTQRNWTSNGLAEFGSILRENSSNQEELAYQVISGLVRHLDINQGGFFTLNHNDSTIEMKACHAYDRKKFPNQTINFGEGLIGAVAIEKKSYYTDKIPDGYLSITSGIGKANPRYLLIVPMVMNDELFGILELASFSPIENYKIQFVERVAGDTATTLNIMESNMRTSQLLSETQEQASQLARQEEQVLQNIEELKLTQTEAARQSEQFVAFTNTVNHTLIRAEYKTDGSLLYANTLFLRSLGYSGNREIDGKHISTFIHEKDQEWFNDIWTKLAAGGVHFEGYMKLITKQGQDFWTVSTYTCMRKEDGSVDKILFLAINSTEQKKISLDFEGQIAAINKLSPKAEFSPDGSFIFYNELFKDALAYNDADLENYSVFDLFSESELERVNEIWDQVLRGNAYQGQLRIKGKNGEEQWFRSSFSVVEDMYGDVSKIVFLGNEITKEKQLENSMREQNIKLKEKEEELRLQSIDLQKELDALNLAWDHERSIHRDETFQFSNIIDKLSYPIIMCNNMSFILYLNPAAENYFRIKQKEVIHEKIHKLLSKSQNSSEIAAFADPAKQISPCNLKSVQIVLADGKICQEKVSIIKSELGAEHSNALIIHTDSN